MSLWLVACFKLCRFCLAELCIGLEAQLGKSRNRYPATSVFSVHKHNITVFRVFISHCQNSYVALIIEVTSFSRSGKYRKGECNNQFILWRIQ